MDFITDVINESVHNWIDEVLVPSIKEACPSLTGEMRNSMVVQHTDKGAKISFTAEHAKYVLRGRKRIDLDQFSKAREEMTDAVHVPLMVRPGEGTQDGFQPEGASTKFITLSTSRMAKRRMRLKPGGALEHYDVEGKTFIRRQVANPFPRRVIKERVQELADTLFSTLPNPGATAEAFGRKVRIMRKGR